MNNSVLAATNDVQELKEQVRELEKDRDEYRAAFIRACAEIAELINHANDGIREATNLPRLTSASVIPRFLSCVEKNDEQ